MVLYIDTTDFNKLTFALSPDGRLRADRGWPSSGGLARKKSYKIDPRESHETLGFLDKFLKSNKIKHNLVKKIIVNKGPGSYTGVRVGVTMAMALGFAWGAKVSALSAADFTLMSTLKKR